MPGYPHLKRPLKYDDIADHLKTLRIVGVPYTDEQIKNAKADLEQQALSDSPDAAVAKSYPKARMGKATAGMAGIDQTKVTEADALVAYLQVLGTMVDFTTVKPEKLIR